MEELSGRGSRRPLRGADEREGKVVVAEIVGGDSIVEEQRVLLWGDHWR